jgi:hypothetical protein
MQATDCPKNWPISIPYPLDQALIREIKCGMMMRYSTQPANSGASVTALTREALYKALRPSAKPRYDTIAKVCGALGVRLVAEPIRIRAE